MTEQHEKLRNMILVAIFAAILAILSQIVFNVPVSPAPITLQTFGIYLIALLLGGPMGALAVLLYLALGAVGLPVFAGGEGGIGVILGPKGGFLLAFPIAAYISGFLITRLNREKIVSYLIAVLPGFLLIFVLGTLQLKLVLGLSLWPALLAGVIPFLPGEALKIFLAVFLSFRIGKTGIIRYNKNHPR